MLKPKSGAIILALLFSFQAQAGIFTDDEAQKKIADQAVEIQNLKAQIKGLEERLAVLEKNPGMIDLATQMQSMAADLNSLRGKIEELNYASENSQKRQKDFYVDLDTRLRKLEPVEAAEKTADAKPDVSENKEYETAFNLFKIGNYQGAISGFQDFLKAHPSSSLNSSAQYWIGNSYFALRDFKNAMASQKALVASYPDSQKVPDALLNIASSQQELGDAKGAKKTLESIVKKYPSSEAATKAKRRLSK